MSQASELGPEESPAPKAGRTKLIAIVIAIVVALVAISAAAVLYLGIGRNLCATPAMVPDVSREPMTSPEPTTRTASPARAGPRSGPAPTQAGLITVGFTISLTGRYTVEGTNSLRGLNTTEQWINTHGGIVVGGQTYNVQLKYYDDQSNPNNIGQLYPTLIQQDGAEFLLAPYSTALTTAAAPIADQYGRVMMSHGGAADTIWTSTNRVNLVEVLSPASTYLRGSVEWIKANHPTDRIAVIHESDAFSTLAAQSAITYARLLGLSVVYNASYPTGTTDLSTQLNAAKLSCADDLIGGGHFNDGLLIMNQLKTTWTPKFVSLLVAVTEPTFQAQLQATANKVVGPSQWESNVTYSPSLAQSKGIDWYGPTPAEFTDLYRSLNGGASPSYHSAEAGAALLVLADAIRRADIIDTAAVRAALGTMHIMTFFGEFQIDSRGLQVAHSMILVQWQAAALKIVQPQDIAESPLQYPYTGS
jgi:branched-chain amino acid transport system substrate-binding protein